MAEYQHSVKFDLIFYPNSSPHLNQPNYVACTEFQLPGTQPGTGARSLNARPLRRWLSDTRTSVEVSYLIYLSILSYLLSVALVGWISLP
jgi:hypothetical protein